MPTPHSSEISFVFYLISVYPRNPRNKIFSEIVSHQLHSSVSIREIRGKNWPRLAFLSISVLPRNPGNKIFSEIVSHQIALISVHPRNLWQKQKASVVISK